MAFLIVLRQGFFLSDDFLLDFGMKTILPRPLGHAHFEWALPVLMHSKL
jgi:hypothetical protein